MSQGDGLIPVELTPGEVALIRQALQEHQGRMGNYSTTRSAEIGEPARKLADAARPALTDLDPS